MMMFFTLFEKLWGGAKKLAIPLIAIGLSLGLDIKVTYALLLVWMGMLGLRTLLGMFSRMDVRFVVVLAVAWVAWGGYEAAHGVFGRWGLLHMALEFAAVVAMAFGTFVSEQYVSGEIAARVRAWWLRLTTGKAHTESNSDVKGSGRLREADDMTPGKMGEFTVDDPGKPHVVLGSLVSERDQAKALKMLPTAKFLRWEPQGHMAVFAGARAGKSTGLIAAALARSWTGSAIVNDIKTELRDWTWRIREREMGHKCVWIDTDPSNGMEPVSWSFDMLEGVDTGPGLIGDCVNIAAVLLPPPKAKDGDNFFLEPARSVVAGSLAYEFLRSRLEGAARPVVSVLSDTLLCSSKEELQAWFTEIVDKMRHTSMNLGLPDSERAKANDIVKFLAEHVKPKEDGPQGTGEMWEKVYATISKELNWLKVSRVARLLSAGTEAVFSIYDIFSGKLTVYVNIRQADLESKPALAAVVFGTFVNLMNKEGDRMKRAGNCLYVLDEALRLGNMSLLYKTGLELSAGAGVLLWFFLQSIQGLKDTAGEGAFASLMDNAIVVHVFGVGDKDTADYVSTSIGNKTVMLANASTSQQGAQRRGDHESINFDSRRVLDPDEILRLPKHLMLTRVKGKDPILLAKPAYFLIPELDARVDRTRPRRPVQATPEEEKAYRESLRRTVEELFGPPKGDLDEAEAAMEATLLRVAEIRPDLIPDVPDMVREAAGA